MKTRLFDQIFGITDYWYYFFSSKTVLLFFCKVHEEHHYETKKKLIWSKFQMKLQQNWHVCVFCGHTDQLMVWKRFWIKMQNLAAATTTGRRSKSFSSRRIQKENTCPRMVASSSRGTRRAPRDPAKMHCACSERAGEIKTRCGGRPPKAIFHAPHCSAAKSQGKKLISHFNWIQPRCDLWCFIDNANLLWQIWSAQAHGIQPI